LGEGFLLIEVIKQFFLDHAVLFGSVGGAVGTGVVVWAIIKSPFTRKPKLELGEQTLAQLKPSEQKTMATLTVPEFIRIRKEMKADLEEEFNEAAENDKAQLRARISELESQITNPEPALAEAQKRIVELEDLLEREGNGIGAERIDAAKLAMEAGDYSLADDIFAEIEARAELEVQRAARAAFGRGEVAEAEIRWHDAAKHYARAAQLDPNFDALRKASDFAERAGDYRVALRYSADLVDFVENSTSTKLQKSSAYNEHALNLKAQGQYVEAEALYREALAIDADTIGTSHPVYAAHLNNLALALKAQGHYAEAEALYREALAIDADTIGKTHPDYAIHLNNLALVLRVQGQYVEAEALYREALAIDADTIGKSHPDYAIDLNNLAGVLEAQGQYAEAEALYREALLIVEDRLGKDHPTYRTFSNNLEILLANMAE
jgi:tetratricopeptide (TPR) repeat protein